MSIYNFQQLKDNKRFESLVADLFRNQYREAEVDIYGRNGQKQHGIDITVQFGSQCKQLWCIQCKNQKLITPKDIDEILKKCTYYNIRPFGKLIIATAAPSDKVIIDYIIGIRNKYKFQIEYYSWDRICDLIEQYPDILSKYYHYSTHALKSEFAAIIVRYEVEAFIQIDPLIEGIDAKWPDVMDDCVNAIQTLLNKYPLCKGEDIYKKILDLMGWIDNYNHILSFFLYTEGYPIRRFVYLPPYDGIDQQYEEKTKIVSDYRRNVAILIYEICTGECVEKKDGQE